MRIVFIALAFLTFSFPALSQTFSPSQIIGVPGISGNTSAGDFDNDGDDDLLYSGSEWNSPRLRLYVLDKGRFTERTNTGLPNSIDARWIDYDGDHDLDVFAIKSDTGISTADFYLNDNGSFNPMNVTLPNLYNASFSVADYDKDGDIDVLMTGWLKVVGQKILLLKNTNNVFKSIELNISSNFISSHAWQDFDNDGDLDVLITGNSSFLYKNEGNDTFSLHSSFPGSRKAIWADFDKDHDLDILLDSGVFRNTNSLFAKSDVLVPVKNAHHNQWIDYDVDGDLDIFLVIASSNGYQARFYNWNNGSYSITEDINISLYSDHNLEFIDYDLDGDYDLTADTEISVQRIFRNNSGTNPYSIDTTPLGPAFLTANKIGATEIELSWRNTVKGDQLYVIEASIAGTSNFFEAGTSTNGATFKVKVQNLSPGVNYDFRVRTSGASGSPAYSNTVTLSTASLDYTRLPDIPVIYIPYSSSWVDINNDGNLDLIYSGFENEAANYKAKTYILKNSNNTFVNQAHNLPEIIGYSMDWADFDYDGDMDLLLAGVEKGATNAKTKLLVNQGNFTFTEYDDKVFTGIRSGFAKWLDVNGDGYQDIYLSGTVNGESSVQASQLLINNRNQGFTEQVNSGLPTIYQSDMDARDFNGDGKIDVVVTGLMNSEYGWLINSGSYYVNLGGNKFKLVQKLEGGSTSVKSADFDMDGDYDIIIQGQIYWNESGLFEKDSKNNLLTFTEGNTVIGDIDNDGDMDIVIGGGGYSFSGGLSRCYLNNGNREFSEGPLPLHGPTNTVYPLYNLGDFDNDGDLDLFDGQDTYASIIRNDIPTQNSKPTPPVITSSKPVAGGILLKWNKGTDDTTPAKNLSSNVYIKDKDGKFLYNIHANVITGRLRKPSHGNIFFADSILFKNLPPGIYEVGVQNIDNSYQGSVFAKTNVEVLFTTPTLLGKAVTCANDTAHVEVTGNNVVWYRDADLKNAVYSGNLFSLRVNGADTTFYAVQKNGEQKSDALKVTIKVAQPLSGQITQSENKLIGPVAESYQWFKDDGMVLNGSINRELITDHFGKYTLRVSNEGCVQKLSYVVRPIKPGVSAPIDICIEEQQEIIAIGQHLKWYDKTEKLIALEVGRLKYGNTNLTDTVVYVTQTVSNVESEKASVKWKVYPSPQSTIAIGDNVLTAPDGLLYQWFYNGSEISGANKRELVPEKSGEYFVNVSNFSCTTTSEKVTIVITSVEDQNHPMSVAHDSKEARLYIWTNSEDIVSLIRIYDMSGKQIYQILKPDKAGEEYVIDTSSIQPGLYVVVVEGREVFRARFAKLK